MDTNNYHIVQSGSLYWSRSLGLFIGSGANLFITRRSVPAQLAVVSARTGDIGHYILTRTLTAADTVLHTYTPITGCPNAAKTRGIRVWVD